MGWKLFWQIILLMVVGTLILSALKIGMGHYRYKCKRDYLRHHPEKSLKK